MMWSTIKSLITATGASGLLVLFSVHVIAPALPRVIGPADYTETRSLEWTGARTLRLTNQDGFVRVWTRPGAECRATAEIRVYSRGENGPAHGKAYATQLVTAQHVDDTIEIMTEAGERPYDLEVFVDYTLEVPRDMDIEISSANGNVWVYDGCGSVRVTGVNSDIAVSRPSGAVDANSVNGRIRVTDAPEGANLHTVNGNVYAHMKGGGLSASTVNGVIVAHVLDPAVSQCDLLSKNGGITLAMAPGCSAQVVAETAHGIVRSDLDIAPTAGAVHRRKLEGIIGEGRTQLQMNTINGNIWIAREP